MPDMLIVYDVSADTAYWVYVQSYFESLPGFNLFQAGRTITVRLPLSQVLTPATVQEFAAFGTTSSTRLAEVSSIVVNCTFADLRQILLDLGFQMKVVTGSHVVFEHGPAHARLVLEPYAEDETVDPATFAIVGRNLDERGILPRARFDELLRERPLAG